MEIDFTDLENYINQHDKFVVSTHQSPDADGIGAQLAFCNLLRELDKETLIINSDSTPANLEFLDVDNEINQLSEGYTVPDNIEEYAQFVLDTNDYDNIGTAYEVLKDRVKSLFIIDHHEGKVGTDDTFHLKAEASSTAEIIYMAIQYFKKELNFNEAQALFTGMVFDTGSFKYPKTTANTYRVAAACLELGVKPPQIHEYLYENNTLSSFKLRSEILSSIEVHHDGKLIAMKLTPDMIKLTGATFEEGEPAINLPLTVKGVVASLLVKHSGNGPVKVSMRTKGNYNVAEIAISNNGGGHKNAAGYQSKLNFDDTYKQALANLAPLFNKN
jgi:bifunctional oligoribonuclease and PAP phosphatase NrnA